jgi:hypothetical protein
VPGPAGAHGGVRTIVHVHRLLRLRTNHFLTDPSQRRGGRT